MNVRVEHEGDATVTLPLEEIPLGSREWRQALQAVGVRE